MPLSHPVPTTPGYEVEFIPLERRLGARRRADRDPKAAAPPPPGQPERRKMVRRGG